MRLVREALQTGQTALLVLYDPEAFRHTRREASLLDDISGWANRVQPVSAHVLAAASHTEHPGGILAVLRDPVWPSLAAHTDDAFGLLLDRVSDPGNAGTILRTAAAFGAGYVVTVPGTTDLLAPKVVRAAMGAHFRLPIYQHVDWNTLLAVLPAVTIVGTDATHGSPLEDFRWPAQTLLVIGSEAEGIDPEAARYIPDRVRIPLRPGVESLNAAVAASIMLYVGLASRRPGGEPRYK